MYRFKCIRCGLCCMKSPISLLPHEDLILYRLAEKYGLEYRSRPGYRVFDAKNGVYIALSYVMDLVNGKCTFLDKNKNCIIHRIYKPLICRSYPYVPKHVSYNVIYDLKMIYAHVDYGISIECPVIEKNKEIFEKIFRLNRFDLINNYFAEERKASLEMERDRNLMLTLLSDLWRKGYIEIRENKKDAPVINLYEFLHRYYPNLPYILGVNEIF